jgi:hypothetical protein
MKIVMLVIGVFALLMGLLWIGQGFGLVMWPSSSFMLEQKIWALWGTVLAAIGALLIWRARR